ncbi:MAG: DUF5668 domain-containing protein [Acidobacteriota bacterium]|nr:DUF5668 domain-containing protein [Acidobacteriota bacterium]
MAKSYRKDKLAWGIILITIGLIFFLNNIGIDFWDSIARLWPIILIVWGVWKLYFGLKERQESPEDISKD